jgi:tetratricopeptide (TPR) repeat protein/peptidoglycan/xylan/chitin deacetylase (PgdA/CDA1 family)
MRPRSRLLPSALCTLLCLPISSFSFADPAPAVSAMTNNTLESLQQQVISLCRGGHCEQAIPLYRQIAALEPDDVEAMKDLMWSLWDAGRIRETIQAAEKALAKSPDDTDILNVLGRAYLGVNEADKALKTYKKLLKISPHQMPVWLGVSRLYADLKEYDDAQRLLEEARERFPGSPELYPRLARVQFLKGDFANAAKSWSRAVQAFPQRGDYRYERARALYYDSRYSEAIAQMENLLDDPKEKRLALDFLTDDALARSDWEDAARRLEAGLQSPSWDDQPRLLRLAEAYRKQGKMAECVATAERGLALNPKNGAALDAKAVCLIEQGKTDESLPFDKRVVDLNPSAYWTLARLADTYQAEGDPVKAARMMAQVRTYDPTDPYLLLAHARALYAADNRQEAQAMLLGWLQNNSAPVLPVFLYHGLTPFERDPMLAYSVHMTTARFEEHMRALVDAHFTPVTAEDVNRWLHGQASLPERPVLITFDDNRMDSFRQADPVLKRTGMKATMFTIVHYADQNYPNYASWKQIKRYAGTGRWDIQSHGDLAHLPVPIDRNGHEGMFLVNKKWLENIGRMENDSEYKRRLELDHLSATQWIGQFVGKRPVAFAWPEGNYGQIGVSNTAKAAALNLEVAKAAYGSTYHQDSYGLNVRTRDPMQLTRYEPHQSESGEDIVRHVHDLNPFSMMRVDLLRWAAWSGRPREAYRWLDELRKNGASERNLWLQEAQIRSAAGDVVGAQELARQVHALEPPPEPTGIPSETERFISALAVKASPVWEPGFSFFADSRERQNWSLYHSLGWTTGRWTDWSVHQAHTSYHDLSNVHVSEDRLGLGVSRRFGLYQSVYGDLAGHVLYDNAPDTLSLHAGARSQWTDDLGTTLEAGRIPVDTGLALKAGIRTGYAKAGARWTSGLWRVEPGLRAASYTDGNRRLSGNLALSRGLISADSGPRVIFAMDGDDTKKTSPFYYAPQSLQEYQLGVDWVEKWGERWEGSARYLPGIGKESNVGATFIQIVDVSGEVHFTERTGLRASFDYSLTPTYHQYATTLSFVWRI